VLEHIVEPRIFLQKLLRRIRAGGGLFVEVPNCGLRRARQISHRSGWQGTGHVNFFGKADLCRLIERAGGEVVVVETAGPETGLVEIPYGRPTSRFRRIMLSFEQRINRRLERMGLRRSGLRVNDDFLRIKPPPHAEGIYLRVVASPKPS
jgi:hypothetical protein